MTAILIKYYFGDYFEIALLFIYQDINMWNYTTKWHLYSFYFPNSKFFLQGSLLTTFFYIFLEYFSFFFKCKKSLPTKLSWVMYNCRKHFFFLNKMWSLSFVLFFHPMYNATHPPSYHHNEFIETFVLGALKAWFLLYVAQVYKLP